MVESILIGMKVVRDPGSKSRGLRKIVGRGVDPATEEFLVGLLGRRESDRCECFFSFVKATSSEGGPLAREFLG